MGDDSPAGKKLAKTFGRKTSAAEDILRASETARRTSAAAERILGMAEPARLTGERIAREQEARRVRMDSLIDNIGKPERERVAREKRAVELTEQLLGAQVAMSQSQAALVELEQLRSAEARHDRKIQYAILVLTALALSVGVIALFT